MHARRAAATAAAAADPSGYFLHSVGQMPDLLANSTKLGRDEDEEEEDEDDFIELEEDEHCSGSGKSGDMSTMKKKKLSLIHI